MNYQEAVPELYEHLWTWTVQLRRCVGERRVHGPQRLQAPQGRRAGQSAQV